MSDPVRVEIATSPLRPGARGAARAVTLAIAAVALLTVPWGSQVTGWLIPWMPLYPPLYAAGMLSALVGAFFFAREFAAWGRLSLLVLAATYVVAGLVPILRNWVDLRRIPAGSIFGGITGGLAMWLVAHVVFALGLACALALVAREEAVPRAARRAWIVLALGAGVAFVALLCVASGAFAPDLPRLGLPDFTGETPLFFAYAWAVIALQVVVLGVVVRLGRRTLLGMWLAVSALGSLAEVALIVAFPARPSIGFWTAPIEGFLSNAVLLVMFLQEGGRLNALVAEQGAWLGFVVDHVADGLLTLDEAGTVTWCNRAAERLFGAPSRELVGSVLRERLPGVPDAALRDEDPPVESTIQRPDGTRRAVEILRTVVPDRAPAAVVIVRDTAHRKRAEQALARARDQALHAARNKSEFLATMSHELRTPINAIVGMSELLGQTALDEEQREYARTVQSSAEALRLIIDDILDLSKLEAGKLQLESVPFDPLEVLETAADLVAAQAQKKGLALVTFLEPAAPRGLYGDPNRLRQVLLNLLSNAVKFTERGRIVVRVLLAHGARDAVTLRLEVEDTGIGIDAEALARLFAPFEQVDSSTSRRFGGTGLGLSISRGLVELMGGRLDVRSTPGAGSTFWFEAPFPQAAGLPDPASRLAGMRILVLHGDDVARAGLERTLRAWGAEVDTAADAAGATWLLETAAASRRFDAAILDEAAPGLDEVLVPLARDALAGASRIVILTAYDARARLDQTPGTTLAFVRQPVRQASLLTALGARGPEPVRPSAEAGEPAAAPPAVDPAFPPPVDRGRQILLADDHEVNRAVAVRQLERLGFSADVVTNGREAVEALGRRRYALVLMDCEMPELDGFEATRRIRAREIETGDHVPIVALTANAMEGDRERCVRAGMDGYLAKPVRLGDLRTVLDQYCSVGTR